MWLRDGRLHFLDLTRPSGTVGTLKPSGQRFINQLVDIGLCDHQIALLKYSDGTADVISAVDGALTVAWNFFDAVSLETVSGWQNSEFG